VIAHVLGLPLEELLPAAGGAGACLIVTKAWLMLYVGGRR
jgi:hypothetical protein